MNEFKEKLKIEIRKYEGHTSRANDRRRLKEV